MSDTPHTVEIVNDLMVVLDRDGNSHECYQLCGLRQAKTQLQLWQRTYAFNYAEAMKAVSDFYSDDAADKALRVSVDASLTKIAKDVLKLPTLDYRHADGLDFHEFSVGQVKLALRAAYEAGRAAKR